MRKTMLILTLILLLINCNDKRNMTGSNYRLFENTPAWELAKAVKRNNKNDFIKALSKDKALIDYQEPKYGNTLLMLTITRQEYDAFLMLLENGADVNILDTYDGSSALMDACEFSFYDVKFIKKLIEYGADVNAIEVGERREGNSTRKTPLINASGSGNLAFVKILVENGADINYMNEYGHTALADATMLKNFDIVLYLLEKGADYTRPIFYRPDYSIPHEYSDPNDKGEPIYLKDSILEHQPRNKTEAYYMNKIIEFIESGNVLELVTDKK